jgi:hypothetical protein
MPLTKETAVDKIEVLEDGTIQVRLAVRILEDDEIISERYRRRVIKPDDTTKENDPRILAIMEAVKKFPKLPGKVNKNRVKNNV